MLWKSDPLAGAVTDAVVGDGGAVPTGLELWLELWLEPVEVQWGAMVVRQFYCLCWFMWFVVVVVS